MRHLESRKMMVEEQTAEPLTEEEIAAIARPAQLSYIAQARYELPAMLQENTEEFCKHDFTAGLWTQRMSEGVDDGAIAAATVPDSKFGYVDRFTSCAYNDVWAQWKPRVCWCAC